MRLLPVLTVVAFVLGCAPDGGELVKSNRARAGATASNAEIADLASDNLAFGADAYAQIAAVEQDFVYSPHSVSIALAMTFAGARGNTAAEMAQALHFELPPEDLHRVFNSLDLALADPGGRVELRSVNQLWGQKGTSFERPFLDTLAEFYGAGMRLLDFKAEPEPSREVINEWVAWHTKDKIVDLLPSGTIDPLTRLVLTNAIYLNAPWKAEFDSGNTRAGAFTLLDGSSASVPFMNATVTGRVSAGGRFRAVEIPYDGDELAMLVLMPDVGWFPEIEGSLAATIESAVAGLGEAQIALSLPKFRETTAVDFKALLIALGMGDAFEDRAADFSGITTEEELYITDILHKAFIDVSEKGTEAAAATAAVMGARSAGDGPIPVRIDRPFVYVVRQRDTGAVLFMGRVLDPR